VIFHWIITWQYPDRGAIAVKTRSGTMSLGRGDTYGRAYDRIREATSDPDGGNVMFFSLEPDGLPVIEG